METQWQVKHTLGQPESLDQIRQLLQAGPIKNRSALAKEICQRFGFLDPRGHPQLSTCMKALRDLEKAGHFALPPPGSQGLHAKRSPRRLTEAVPAPQEVPMAAGEVQNFRHPALIYY